MIKIISWRPELELGVDMMDRHHRGMVRLCGAISDRAGSRSGGRAASELFMELVGLTAMHFEAEEELMRRSDYPGRVDHQDRHHELSLLLRSWEHRARQGQMRFNNSFLQHLSRWIENHILGSDKGFSRFLLGEEGIDPTNTSRCFHEIPRAPHGSRRECPEQNVRGHQSNKSQPTNVSG